MSLNWLPTLFLQTLYWLTYITMSISETKTCHNKSLKNQVEIHDYILLELFCFWDFETKSQVAKAGSNSPHYIVKDDPELLILLPPPPKWLDYMSPWPVHVVLGIELKALCTLGNHSTNWTISPDIILIYIKNINFLSIIIKHLFTCQAQTMKISSDFILCYKQKYKQQLWERK